MSIFSLNFCKYVHLKLSVLNYFVKFNSDYVFKYPYVTCGLVHNELWIRASPLLDLVNYLPQHNYFKLKHYPFRPNCLSDPSLEPLTSSPLVRSLSHHHSNLLETCIRYA